MPAKNSKPSTKQKTVKSKSTKNKSGKSKADKSKTTKAKKQKKGLTYADSGVSIDEGNSFASHIFDKVGQTYSDRVQHLPGGFASLFAMGNDRNRFAKNWRKPSLVACTDGVGTKLKLAIAMKKHDTVGIDCVAMNVNDMICLGAAPLFFLDYIGIGKVTKKVTQELLAGLIEGCTQSACALIGGETSEMPDVYGNDDYDLVGFAVGALEEGKEITGANTRVGDVIIGLPSSGIHSNGFSLARKALFEVKGWKVRKKHKALEGLSLGEELLKPTKIYVKTVLALLEEAGRKQVVRGMAHITGGGLLENLPRALPEGMGARLDATCWKKPAIFDVIQQAGDIDGDEMYRVFNMGIGYTITVAKAHADFALQSLKTNGEKGASIIGEVVAGDGEVVIENR